MSDDKMIRRVQGLLDKAGATEFAEEREALLAKADELMAKYSIEQFQIEAARLARGEAASMKVEHITIEATGDQAENIMKMMYTIGRLIGTRGIYSATGSKAWRGGRAINRWSVRFYGFRVDLDYLERLNIMLQMAILSEIDPKVNQEETFAHNVYRLRATGMAWPAIGRIMTSHRFAEDGTELWEATPVPEKGSVLVSAYRKECRRLGVDARAFGTGRSYRYSFMNGFSNAVITRIADVRRAAASEAGTEIVLRDKNKQVDEAFENDNPDRKSLVHSKVARFDHEAVQRGYSAGQRADIGITRVGSKSNKAISR